MLWDHGPADTVRTRRGLVCSVDRLASAAGARLLADGGSAADAAVAASAVLSVTAPHMCGMGGDLFALVHRPGGSPAALNASGRAGSGADPERLLAEGRKELPFRGDPRSAPVPGCVDGWLALHEAHGRLDLAAVLDPAIALARNGFPASPLLAWALPMLDGVEGCDELAAIRPEPGDEVRRPGVAATLRAVARDGRQGFYGGPVGRALLEAGNGEYSPADLATVQAEWVEPLGLDVFGHRVWTIPPNSQGYLTLAAAGIAERSGLLEGVAGEPDDPLWAHVLVEAARLAGFDREAVLHDGADGAALLAPERLAPRARALDPDHALPLPGAFGDGGTMYLCTADADGCGVSLIQSNASGFGCHVALPGTGILLHNRGVGFGLEAGHPARYGPGRRPPHTLSPALVTRFDGSLRALVGTMGGDSQPQIVLQLLARHLLAGQDPGVAVGAPRLTLANDDERGFGLWRDLATHRVRVEGHAPPAWADGLRARGHRVELVPEDVVGFGHAHVIEVAPDGSLAGAADPRSLAGAAVSS